MAPTGVEFLLRRDAGVVERGGLENRGARERTEGSNPSLSANDLYTTVRDYLRLSGSYLVFDKLFVSKG